MKSNARTTRSWVEIIGTSVIALLLVPGCGRQSSSYRHELLSGTVESLQAGTGELTVRVTGQQPRESDDQKILCLLTNDTELYINDMFSSPAEVAPGDSVELIGYRDPDPAAERFIVSLAHVIRPLPPLPVPELLSPPGQPPDQLEEK